MPLSDSEQEPEDEVENEVTKEESGEDSVVWEMAAICIDDACLFYVNWRHYLTSTLVMVLKHC